MPFNTDVVWNISPKMELLINEENKLLEIGYLQAKED